MLHLNIVLVRCGEFGCGGCDWARFSPSETLTSWMFIVVRFLGFCWHGLRTTVFAADLPLSVPIFVRQHENGSGVLTRFPFAGGVGGVRAVGISA